MNEEDSLMVEETDDGSLYQDVGDGQIWVDLKDIYEGKLIDHTDRLNINDENCCCSVSKLCLTLRFHGLQHARLLCPLSLPKFMSIE